MTLLKKVLIWLLLGVTVVLGLWIGHDNSAPTSLVLLGFALGEMPLAFWVLAAFAIGLIFGVLATLPPWLTARRRIERLRRRLLDAERKLAKLSIEDQRPQIK